MEPFSKEGQLYSKELVENFEYSRCKGYIDNVFNTMCTCVEYATANLIPGEIAEFGTGFGLSARFLSYFNKRFSTVYGQEPKELHFFDSFEGLPSFNNEFDKKTRWSPGDYKGLSSDELLSLASEYTNNSKIHIYKGWFDETLISINTQTKFSLVHIDSDLYDSASGILNHIFKYKLLCDGAYIIFDDYNCHSASPELGERKAWSEAVENFNVHFSNMGFYGLSGWKCIVHSYD